MIREFKVGLEWGPTYTGEQQRADNLANVQPLDSNVLIASNRRSLISSYSSRYSWAPHVTFIIFNFVFSLGERTLFLVVFSELEALVARLRECSSFSEIRKVVGFGGQSHEKESHEAEVGETW